MRLGDLIAAAARACPRGSRAVTIAHSTARASVVVAGPGGTVPLADATLARARRPGDLVARAIAVAAFGGLAIAASSSLAAGLRLVSSR